MSLYLVQGIALGFAAMAQPGPFLAYLINQALTLGFRKAWTAAFAPLLSDGPIIALALLVLVQMPAWLQRGLNLASGCFILYLAWSAFKQWRSFESPDSITSTGNQQGIFKAAFMNILNPMPYIYWSLVTGPILLEGWRESSANGLAFISGFYVTMISGLIGIVGVFSVARNLGSKISRALLGFSVLALTLFGLLQIWRALQG